jgi:hypothetical protein
LPTKPDTARHGTERRRDRHGAATRLEGDDRGGGSIYLLIKIAGALGVLRTVGAQTAGMTLEQFMAKRKGG